MNMPDPFRPLSESSWKHWPEAGRMILAQQLASRLDPFGQNWVWAGFAQCYSGCLWMNKTESKSLKLVSGWLHPAKKQAK